MKKDELVESAEKYLSGSRWLPDNLKVKPSPEIYRRDCKSLF
jgi:ParB family chromosome partitioning protein